VEDEGESGESDDEDTIKSVEDLNKLVPCTLEQFAKVPVSLSCLTYKAMASDRTY
jgi:hypothetical protein